MTDGRDDEAENNFALEFSGLDEKARPTSDAAGETAKPRDSAQDNTSRIITENDLRSHPRTHLLRAGVTILAVVLAVAVILVTFPNAASQLKAPLQILTPEPTVTLPRGSDIVLLAHTVPWGQLRVDGRTDGANDLGNSNGYHAYRLPPGQHTLDYVAEPFPAVHCIVSAPSRASDTCKAPRDPVSIGEALRALDMNATVTTMDSSERAKLQTLLENGASYPDITIEPGMHYLDQNGNIAIARERMTVTMSVGAIQPGPDTDFNFITQECGEFCSMSQQDDPIAWDLVINIEQRWTYVTANNAGLMARSPSATGFTGAQVSWIDGEWTLMSDILPGNNCWFPRQFEHFDIVASKNDFLLGPVFSTPISANGCVIEYSQGGGDNQPKAQLLYRFGLTLAVDANAQHIFPDLPVANDSERAIAQAIRAGQG